MSFLLLEMILVQKKKGARVYTGEWREKYAVRLFAER